VQPNSFGYSFEGPALQLECVAALKADKAAFLRRFPTTPRELRRPCFAQLLQSLTPEPDFTADEFKAEIVNDPNRNLSPKDPATARRIGNRLGVNINVAEAVEELVKAKVVDDPGAVSSLIRCLDHPLLEVSRRCQNALVYLTHHGYGQTFYYNSRTRPTEEARRKLIADWNEWSQSMKNGHPVFDEWLESRCLSAVRAVGERLQEVLKGTVAAGYLEHQVSKTSGFHGGDFFNYPEIIFSWGVGASNAANWMSRTGLDWVGISVFRPGIPNRRSSLPEGVTKVGVILEPAVSTESTFRESFPALDLEFRVVIVSTDPELRKACFRAATEALAQLRSANAEARTSR
jgi:hypothetical protein